MRDMTREECDRCEGTGRRSRPPYDRENHDSICKNCDGDGFWWKTTVADLTGAPVHGDPPVTISDETKRTLDARKHGGS
jgi:hypothetical protein